MNSPVKRVEKHIGKQKCGTDGREQKYGTDGSASINNSGEAYENRTAKQTALTQTKI